MSTLLEYKCPCCNAGLVFGSQVQQLKCEYCDNTFEIDAVKAFNETEAKILAQAEAINRGWDYEIQKGGAE